MMVEGMNVGRSRILNSNIKREANKGATPSFTNGAAVASGLNVVTKALQLSDKNPMIGVSIIDLSSMIGPRAYIDGKNRNVFAGVETFIRESSGLIINCLTPGAIVLGGAKLIKDTVMGNEFKNIKTHKIWADEVSIQALKKSWTNAADGKNWHKLEDAAKDKHLRSYVENILDNVEGLSGDNNWVKLKDLKGKDKYYNKIIDSIKAKSEAPLKGVANEVAEKFGASRELRFTEDFAEKLKSADLNPKDIKLKSNLSELLRDTYKMGETFMEEAVTPQNIDTFATKLSKFVSKKSFLGLGISLTLGASVQKINRYLTKKRSGVDGFVGYSDFANGRKNTVTEKDKKALTVGKLVSAAGMIGLAVFSMGSRKNISAKMFQFKGPLPSLNQCRVISTGTILGRIAASEDKNELKETTFRDYLGFANLYLLGDFVAKGVGDIIQKSSKGKHQLINVTDKAGEGFASKAKHWISNKNLKSFEEIASVKTKNMRGIAQASGLAYSMIALGILVPKLNIWMTNKSEAKRKAQEGTQENVQISAPSYPAMTSAKNFSSESKKLYSAFIK